MAKRSDTLETVLLAVELLRRIPRGRKITARELHHQLKDAGIERDLRTIDLQLIDQNFAAVAHEIGRPVKMMNVKSQLSDRPLGSKTPVGAQQMRG